MPMWRCPHCGTPQLEASRCWVCRRSSTSCATCRDFRQSVTGGGYCAADRGRAGLSGHEVRACWQAPSRLVATAVTRSPKSRSATLRAMPIAEATDLSVAAPLADLELIALTDTAGKLWADAD